MTFVWSSQINPIDDDHVGASGLIINNDALWAVGANMYCFSKIDGSLIKNIYVSAGDCLKWGDKYKLSINSNTSYGVDVIIDFKEIQGFKLRRI